MNKNGSGKPGGIHSPVSPEKEETLDFAALIDLYPPRAEPETPAAKKKGPLVYSVNLEAGMPTVEEALCRMRAGLQEARMKHCRVVRFIHGYGSTGKGGAIRAAVRNELKNAIPGEEFDSFHEPARRLLEQYPELKKDPDFNRCNHGVTLKVLR